ncbi:14712_t:CDS:1, partial [Acaulospora colombiana]
ASSQPLTSSPNTTGKTLDKIRMQLRASFVGLRELPVILIGNEFKGLSVDEMEGGGEGKL